MVGVIPIRERGAFDTEGEALVRLVDGVGAEMGKAATHDRFVFIRGSGGTVVGRELGEVGTYEYDRIATIGAVNQNAFGVGTKCVGFISGLLGYGRDERPASD